MPIRSPSTPGVTPFSAVTGVSSQPQPSPVAGATGAGAQVPELKPTTPEIVANLLRRATGPQPDGLSAVALRARPDLNLWVERLLASGITQTEHWQDADTAGRVGMVGEATRLLQIAQTGPGPELKIFQGLVLVELPAGLDICNSSRAAAAWCHANQQEPGRLTRFTGEDGLTHYGLMVTEMDVVVFEQTAAGLALRRVENVKAGVDAGQCARRQNRQVVERFARPDVRFLFPEDGGLVDHNSKLTRTKDVSAQLASQTVGPADGFSYDIHLPLSRQDVVDLVERLVARTGGAAEP